MSRDILEIVNELRRQVSLKGECTITSLTRRFAVEDRDKSGDFDFDEFESILGKVGLFLRRQELRKLFNHFDVNGDARVSYEEFLNGLQGRLGPGRMQLIKQAFARVDTNGSGHASMKDCAEAYRADLHPRVLLKGKGKKSEEEVLADFMVLFGLSGKDSASWEEFLEFYRGVSASVPYDDTYFTHLMENTWQIKAADSAIDNNEYELLVNVSRIIREKVAQKSKGANPDSESMRKAFRYVDIRDQGVLALTEFQAALTKYGILLEANVFRSLFRVFDKDMSGTVNYNAFVDAVYAEDTGDSTIQELKTQRIKAVASQPDDGRDPYDMTMASTRGLLPVVSERPRRKNKPRYDAKSNTYTTKARGSSVLFVVGGPSSGKSGLCHALSNEAGYVHIDVPYLLQLEAEHGTGREAQQIRDAINAQRMVPVETTIAVIRTAIQDNAEQGHNQFALDGFPRSIANWKLWMKQCGDISTELIVFLDAPVDILQRRLEAQSRETGEEPESIKYRLGSYVETTVPLKQQLQDNNKLKVVACKDRPEADIFQEVARML